MTAEDTFLRVMTFTRLSTFLVAALLLAGCSDSAPPLTDVTVPTQLGSCPFGLDAGNGILMSPAIRAELDDCNDDRALCSIRLEVPCAAVGPVITQWACDCSGGKWRCEVSARNPAACPDGGPT